MKLYVGLGNPGRKYADTRHNLGAIALNTILKQNFREEKKLLSLVANAMRHNEKIIAALPQTFMNLSGDAVVRLMKFHNIAVEDLVIIHDEIELTPFEIRYKFGGGHKGHNGLRDIIAKIGSADFHRIRLGVGRPENKNFPVADFLLSKNDDIPPRFFENVEQLLSENNL